MLELLESGKVQQKQYYVTDPYGNVVQLTDEDGKVTRGYEYDTFGNEIDLDGKDDNPFRYCGEYLDKETGEIYLRARYYQPAVGRFLTRDTYTGEEEDMLSLHLYTYCKNDGVNAWDPSGHYIDTLKIYYDARELFMQLSQADGPYPFAVRSGLFVL